MKQEMIHRVCPFCSSKKNKIKYAQNYSLQQLKDSFFSARRERKKVTYEHNNFRRCSKCNAIYVSPILNPELISKLYKKSKFTYGKQRDNLKKSYGRYLKIAEKYVKNKGKILDIGGGDGFFMEEALSQGYKEAYGVEPSKHAVELAPKKLQKNIVIDMFKDKQFKPEFFDVITFFHVLDHIIDPNEFLQICRKYLKKDGVIICITHNVEALSAKIMGEHSPIFDIEHTQLFSKKSIAQIFENNKFKPLKVLDVINTYTLGYWINAAPLPAAIKYPSVYLFKTLGLLDRKVTIKPGNLCIIARK
jgi:2-polyprenyl-3-methyl-5-hydroxy-6-metoxy-1,4-benzoquinol methylase